MDTPELTPAELRFCEEYAADPNATQAYRRAHPGSSYATAKRMGWEWSTKPHLQAEIEAIRESYRKQTRVNALRVLRELANLGFFDWADVLEADETCNDGLPKPKAWRDVPPAARRALTKVKIKRKRLLGGGGKDDTTCWEVEDIEYVGPDKMQALDRLCKHLGLTNDGEAIKQLLAEIAAAKAPEGGS